MKTKIELYLDCEIEKLILPVRKLSKEEKEYAKYVFKRNREYEKFRDKLIKEDKIVLDAYIKKIVDECIEEHKQNA